MQLMKVSVLNHNNIKELNNMKYLINLITLLLLILTISHYYRNLNYIVLLVLLIAWLICSFMINRLNSSKF